MHPKAVPELLAYHLFILRASQDFGGVAWVTYNAAFWHQACTMGNLQWLTVNLSLYSICFLGVAHTGMHYAHPTCECTLVC